MNRRFAALGGALAAVAALTSTLLIAGGGGADAQGTPPPWAPGGANPDQNAVGGLTFYDSTGTPITSGSTNTAPFAKYVVGRVATQSASLTGPTATVYLYLPHEGLTPDQWHDFDQLGSSTDYPNSQAPGSLATAAPMNTGAAGDLTIEGAEGDFPNNSTTTGYQNTYEVRLYTSAHGSSGSTHYDYADISVNKTAHTWTLVYSPGTAPTTPTATAPGKPTAVQATAGNASATVSWTAPADNGGATISGYNLQYSTDGGSTWTSDSANPHTATSATLTGLTNGTPYVFHVAAINSAGAGTYSDASAAATPQPPVAPGKPTAVHAAAGNDSATVSWTAPTDDGGAPLTGYHVQYSSDSGATWTDGPSAPTTSTATTTTVSGLTNGTAYVFHVAAINSAGTGAYSDASTAATPQPPTAPGKPALITATVGNASATVSWTAPSDDGGAPLTGYDLEYSADSAATWTSVSSSFHTSTATSGNVTGLANGTAYKFRVAGINSAGTGAYSDPSIAVTPSATAADGSRLDISAALTVKYGKAALVRGRLSDSRTEAPLGGQRVALYGRHGSATFRLVATATTDASGAAAIKVRPTSAEQFEWQFAGASTHTATTSAIATVRVSQVIAARVTSKHARHGKRVKFYGRVSPSATGHRVALQIYAGGRWKTVRVAAIHRQRMPSHHRSTGFVITYRLPQGVTKCRLYIGARTGLTSAHSAVIKVRGT